MRHLILIGLIIINPILASSKTKLSNKRALDLREVPSPLDDQASINSDDLAIINAAYKREASKARHKRWFDNLPLEVKKAKNIQQVAARTPAKKLKRAQQEKARQEKIPLAQRKLKNTLAWQKRKALIATLPPAEQEAFRVAHNAKQRANYAARKQKKAILG